MDQPERTIRLQRSLNAYAVSTGKLQLLLASDLQASSYISKISSPNVAEISIKEAIETMARDLENAVEELIRIRVATRGSSRYSKMQNIKAIVSGWIRASYPFLNTLLSVAKEGASVSRIKCTLT